MTKDLMVKTDTASELEIYPSLNGLNLSHTSFGSPGAKKKNYLGSHRVEDPAL